MKRLKVATAIKISALPLAMLLVYMNAPKTLSVVVCMVLATIGFTMQLYSSFKMRADHEREMAVRQAKHDTLMANVRQLPPEYAFQLLLKNMR
ncbi:MAG TPA: hypothetical protein VEA59_06485 [Patescibacteria group bacterium]|nr:hypothetical protein [Patescibacteria group bacterium]